jgi:hypothetical protein
MRITSMPSPTGRNACRAYIAPVGNRIASGMLPAGMTFDKAQALLDRTLRSPMAMDAGMPTGTMTSTKETLPSGELVAERPWDTVMRLVTEAGLDDAKMDVLTEALSALKDGKRHMHQADEPESEEGALDQESERPAWCDDERQRVAHWKALDAFLRRRGATGADMEEIKPVWESRYGALPKRNALAGDRKRRQLARDERAARQRWPDSVRLDPSAALETLYGEQPRPAARAPTPEACFDRWPQAARIGHV